MKGNEQEIKERYLDENITPVLSIVPILIVVATIVIMITAVYGAYRFYTRGEVRATIVRLNATISSQSDMLKTQRSHIRKLEKEVYLLHQAQSMENFLTMLLNNEQKKNFETVEEYLKQYMMEKKDGIHELQ